MLIFFVSQLEKLNQRMQSCFAEYRFLDEFSIFKLDISILHCTLLANCPLSEQRTGSREWVRENGLREWSPPLGGKCRKTFAAVGRSLARVGIEVAPPLVL
jgi:hypothetical protein